jgi:hypothetical protein
MPSPSGLAHLAIKHTTSSALDSYTSTKNAADMDNAVSPAILQLFSVCFSFLDCLEMCELVLLRMLRLHVLSVEPESSPADRREHVEANGVGPQCTTVVRSRHRIFSHPVIPSRGSAGF